MQAMFGMQEQIPESVWKEIIAEADLDGDGEV